MEFKYELENGCLTIRVPKELDHHCATQLRAEADLLIDSYRVNKLVFDFAGTEFMDSSGIGVVIGRCRNMNYSGGKVVAENMNERIRKIFVVSGLHKLVQMKEKSGTGKLSAEGNSQLLITNGHTKGISRQEIRWCLEIRGWSGVWYKDF